MNKRITFYAGFTTLIMGTILVVAFALTVVTQQLGKSSALVSAKNVFKEVSTGVSGDIGQFFESFGKMVDAIASAPGISASDIRTDFLDSRIQFMIAILQRYPELSSLYIGFASGDFLQVVSLENVPYAKPAYKALPETSYLIRSITRNQGARVERRAFHNKGGKMLKERIDNAPSYDPRTRPWYIEADKEGQLLFTPPYIFFSTKSPGMTCAVPTLDGRSVLAADITLDNVNRILSKYRVSENASLFIADQTYTIIAHPRVKTAVEVLKEGSTVLQYLDPSNTTDSVLRAVPAFLNDLIGSGGQVRKMDILGQPHLGMALDIKLKMSSRLHAVIVAPVSDFTGFLKRMLLWSLAAAFIVVVVVASFALYFSRRLSRSLNRVAMDAQRAQKLDFSDNEAYDSHIFEVHILIKSLNMMRKTIRDYMADILDTQHKLETLVDKGISLSAEKDIEKLLDRSFAATSAVSPISLMIT